MKGEAMEERRILVVEDEGIIARDLEGTLRAMGYEVCGAASTGEEAVRLALERRPDLALMDVVLRGKMDGVAAAEEIRSRLGIPVVFLTAYADEKTLQRAKISGPFGYVLKPFEERGLRGAIEIALQVHGMEKKLRGMAEEWQSTFDSIQDWVSIHDRDFRIVRVNRAMAGALGRSPEDLIGKSCYRVLHGGGEPMGECPHRRALEAGKAMREEIFEPSLGMHLEVSVSPVFDEKGGVRGTVHIVKDISERKKAEEELRRSEERYRLLFESLPVGLYRSTPGGKLLDANPAMARLLGCADTDALLRADLTDTYVNPRDRERFKALMEEKGLVDDFRVERRRKDGSRFWGATRSRAVRGPDGEIQYYEGSLQDVSERQAFEEELARSEDRARKLAREKSILAEIGRIISSTPDTEEVYKSFAAEVRKLLPFDRLIISLLDREKKEMINRFIEGTSVPGRNVGEPFPLRGTFGERVIESGKGILLRVEDEEETIARFPGLLPDIRGGMKSALSVPLFHRLEPVGVLHIFSARPGAYREEDLPVARSIADQIAGAIASGRLFEELRRTAAALKESEERNRVLVEAAGRAGEGVAILQDGGSGEAACVFANDRAQKILGYTMDEIRSLSWKDVVPESQWDFVNERLRRRMEGEDAPGLFEMIVRKKSGGEAPIEIIGTPVRYQGGPALAVFFRDISDRRRAEEAVRRGKEFYEAVINSLKDGLSIIDVRDWRIVDMNRAFVEGKGGRREDWIGKTCHEVTHRSEVPCAAPEHGCPVARVLATGGAATVEHVHFGGGGARKHVEVSSYPIRDEGGRIVQVVHLERDVTEKRQMEQRLARAQKLEAVGQLAAGIAHEINTPTQYVGDNTRFLQGAFRDLSGLLEKVRELMGEVKAGGDFRKTLGEAEEVEEKIGLSYLLEEVPRAIAQTLEGVDRVARIVRAMKEFSHPGVKEKTLVDLNRAIENTLAVSRNEWKYVAELETDFDAALPEVPCHVGEFNQAILNLVVNAAQAIGEASAGTPGGKGKIRVSTRRKDGWAEVRIADTGPGIPEGVRSRIFDPFFTTKEVGRGTGQGLSICHSVIVEKHGGTIDFETEEGRGTTFIVRLPLNAPEGGGKKPEGPE